MEIQVVEKQADTVRVTTPIGCFNGIWCSSSPVVSQKYNVELDSDEVLTLDAVEFSNSNNPSIEYLDGRIIITGFVEEVQDVIMVLRLQKSIVMFEICSNLDFLQYVNHYVRIRLKEIKLYDIEVRQGQ